jgi:RNA polymerase sigma-70 factor (ECF subfamily)
VRHQKVKANYRNEIFKSTSLNDFDLHDHPFYRLHLSELRKRIDSAITSLPEKCRKIFEMNRFEDMTYKEIADYFDITISTVQTQVRRALERISERLDEE